MAVLSIYVTSKRHVYIYLYILALNLLKKLYVLQLLSNLYIWTLLSEAL